jgi:tRNA threonylcarbamoyladenosine biosynthesis protein TsaB
MAYGAINIDKNIPENTLLCPMIDARRMEVFTAVFDCKGQKIKQTAAEIITTDSFGELLNDNKMLFFGDGAEKCKAVLGANPNAQFLPGFVNSASYLTQKALEKFKKKEFESVVFFEPYYLKDFIAGKRAV